MGIIIFFVGFGLFAIALPFIFRANKKVDIKNNEYHHPIK